MDPLNVTLELVRVEEAADPAAFRRGVQEYLLRSDDGTYAPATLRWDDDLAQTLAGARERRPEAVQRLGEVLRRFLAVTRFAAAEAAIEAALKDRRPVRLEIASNAAEIYALPWELLGLRDGRHLGELPGLEVAYRWPGAQPAADARPPAREGGRVLVAWSRSHGNVGETYLVDAIDAAMRAGHAGFERARDVVADASLPAITTALAAGDPPTCLVLLCHGAASATGYGLGLDDGRGGRQLVDGGALRRALAPFAGHLRAVLVLACDSGNPGELGAQLGSVAHELHRGGLAAVVAPRYPVTGAAALALTGHVLSSMLRETCTFERAFQAAREAWLRGGSADFAAFQLYSHGAGGTRPFALRPYRGLLAFEREHADLFFGRDAELAEALRDLDALIAGGRPRVLVVAGASGTGKSSLVLAPLRVALEARGDHVAVMRPGSAPREALAAALRARPPGRRCVLVVDQFEEVFTHGVDRGQAEAAGAFVRELWDMVSRTGEPIAAILTLRVDFVGRCGELALDDAGARLDRVVYDEAFRVFVPQMGPEALHAVIERPAARVGLRLEAGLAERLIREVSGESNALPLLSYVLDELWRRRVGDALTHAALDATGGVIGALARHADAVVDALDEPGRTQARRILVRLVTFGSDRSSGARRREDIAHLRSQKNPDAWDRAATALIDARLVVRRSDAAPTLEIAHEALIRHWDRLWTWYQADRDRLAKHHELERLVAQYHQYGALTGKALAFGQELIAGLDPDDVVPDAWQMIATSAARARRQQLLRRGLVVGALVVLSLFSAVTLTFYLRSNKNAAEARVAAKQARNAARVAAASRLLPDKPHVAAALLDARNDDRDAVFGWNQAAFQTLHEPLPAIWQLPEGPRIEDLAFTADGALLALDVQGGLTLFPAEGGPPRELGVQGLSELRVNARGDLVFAIQDKKLTAFSLGPAGLSKRAELPLRGDLRELRLGKSDLVLLTTAEAQWPPGAVVATVTEEQSALQLVGDRLEPRHTRPPCRLHDDSTERSLCSLGDDAVQVVTWTGEPVGRVDSPKIGAWGVMAVPGGLQYSDVDITVAWHWPPGGLPGERRVLPSSLLGEGSVSLNVYPRYTVSLASTGMDNTPGRLCSLAARQDATPVCQEVAHDCHTGAPVGGQFALACKDEVRFLTAETLLLARHLRGLDTPAWTVDLDPRGHVALADDARRVWRWRAQDIPSRLAVLDRAWLLYEPAGYTYLPYLQSTQGRIAAVEWDYERGFSLDLWPLRADKLPAFPQPLSARAEAPTTMFRGVAVTRDAVLVAGSSEDATKLAVFTPREAAIDHRVLTLPPEASGQLLHATPDGQVAFLMGLQRVDLRGAVPRVTAVPKTEDVIRILDVDPAGETLVHGQRPEDQEPAEIVDATTGEPLLRAGALAGKKLSTATFAPDGRTLALGGIDGSLVLATREGRTLTPLRTLDRHRATIAALSFSRDGQTLVSADLAGKLVAWRGLVDDPLRTVIVEVPEEIWQIGVAPAGDMLWALDRHGVLRYWTLHAPAALASELAARTSYCLGAREWTELVGATPTEADELARKACRQR